MNAIARTLALLLLAAAPLAAQADVLISINGEDITTELIDDMIIGMHQEGSMQGAMNRDLTSLLDKSINDMLIVQQALAMGMDEDPTLLPLLAKKRSGYAVQAFVDDTFTPPPPVIDAEVRADFEAYYWQIQVRQVSFATEKEAAEARREILDGTDMAALAEERSLDVHRFRGGLHNLKYWADVENPIREQVRGERDGFLSQPFPYRQAYSLLSIEDLRPVDEAAFEQKAPIIRVRLEAAARDRAWDAYIAGLKAEHPVVQHEVLFEIRMDGDQVFESSFLIEDERPALSCGDRTTSAGAMRKAVSRLAMENGTTPFEQLMVMALDAEGERIALRAGAFAGGYGDRPEVEKEWLKDRDEALIQAYLAETIVEDITFRHDEFDAFYQEHIDDFRGPEQVRLDVVVLPDEGAARAMEEHLAQGADFDYVRNQHIPEQAGAGQPEWAPLDVFSKVIRDEVERLETGGSSKAIPIPTGWMIFRVLDRRDGRLPTLEEVDMQIRQVMFQRKFNERLDDHIELLKERSEIVRHEESLKRYFSAGSE